MYRILVLCSGNSCRSQMAEGYLREFTGERAEIYSAGLTKQGVNSKTVDIMKEDGIDISKHTANLVDEYKHINFDYILTLSDEVINASRRFPSQVVKYHVNFPDPSKARGEDEKKILKYREVRDMIKSFVSDFVDERLPG